MKAPKSVVDKTAAYMNKGIKETPAQNAPKGVDFAQSETHPAKHVGLGMNQHRAKMNEHGTRHKGPNEHMDPSHKLFDTLGKF